MRRRRRTPTQLGSVGAASQRLRWIFPKELAVVAGKSPKIDEAVLHGDRGDSCRRRLASSKKRVNCTPVTIPTAAIGNAVAAYTVGFVKLKVHDRVEDAIGTGSGTLVRVGKVPLGFSPPRTCWRTCRTAVR